MLLYCPLLREERKNPYNILKDIDVSHSFVGAWKYSFSTPEDLVLLIIDCTKFSRNVLTLNAPSKFLADDIYFYFYFFYLFIYLFIIIIIFFFFFFFFFFDFSKKTSLDISYESLL